MAFPRLIARAGNFAFFTVPEKLDGMLGFGNGGSVIAQATGGNESKNIFSAAISGVSGSIAMASQGTVAATAAGAGTNTDDAPGVFSSFTFHQVRNFGGIVSYMTSKWALACCCLVSIEFVGAIPRLFLGRPSTDDSQAIVLNRTQIYASARRRINLTWPIRLIVRIAPIFLFCIHTLSLLQAMRCQTSSLYPSLKYGKPDMHVDLDFSGDEGFLYYLSSTLLFWENDTSSCLAVDMVPSDSKPWEIRGSLSLLWPFFQALCFGQFVETLSCALQGRQLMTETGMSIFEHSLAFAEAEGMLSSTLGLSPFGLPSGGMGGAKFSAEGSGVLTRNALFYKLNTPPEVLLLALISALNNLSSQMLGVFNMQNRFRLVNTGIWGVCFMGAFIWGFFSLRPESGPDNIILRIPTVCIVGFIPHLLIIIGMLLCAFIYLLALTLCFLSPPADSAQPRNLRERYNLARENMQANAQISSIRIDMQEDFYTALLKIGFSALTVASEAVYLNEGQRITVASSTWLEEERMKEVESFENAGDPAHSLSVRLEDLTDKEKSDGVESPQWRSGYSRQTTIKIARSASRARGHRADGIGHMQRGGRYIMAYEYFEGIFWLFVGWLKVLANKMLDKLGIVRRPHWLRSPKRKAGVDKHLHENGPRARSEPLDFWILSDEGVMSLPETDDVDVEIETRKRLMAAADREWETIPDEDKVDQALYEWWKHNGWWGERDESGSYSPSQPGVPNDENDDLTSVISVSSSASEAGSIEGDEDDDDGHTNLNSGRTTPTQSRPDRHVRPRSPSPSLPQPFTDHPLSPTDLAALLTSSDPTTRSEAQMLAHHLTSPKITTRSAYTSAISSRAAKLLTSTRLRPPGSRVTATGPLSRDEEAQLLEEMIFARRWRSSTEHDPHPPSSSPHDADRNDFTGDDNKSWRAGGDGAGSGGPQCVVCQSAPRTVLAWPCRCLSLCEECRVSLAMNNFATCVCCRRDVVGFSRLFVP